ncbi:acyltransferase family protein [Chitinimonas naiadis]
MQSLRNAYIDSLRGVAILLVLLLHFTLAFGLKNSPLGDVIPAEWLSAVLLNGNYGVTIFFVISGFLITGNALGRFGHLSRIDLRTFYSQRFARLLPCLLLALAIIVPLGCLEVPFFDNADDGKQLPISYFLVAVGSILTFWHNVLMQSAGYFNYCLNVYWSLSVEMLFYLVFPLACLLLRRHALLALLGLGLIAYAPYYRAQHVDNEIFFMYGYQACFDAIALGCLSAILLQRWQPGARLAAVVRPLAALALAVCYLRGIHGNEVWGFTLIGLCTAALLITTPAQAAGRWLQLAPMRGLRWLGEHSYELYLFHVIVLAVMRNITDRAHLSYTARLPWLLLFLVAAVAVAGLVARYMGNPANRFLLQRLGVARGAPLGQRLPAGA